VNQLVAGEAGLRVEVIRNPAAWDDLEPEYDELFEASPTASPPLHRDWLRSWWRIYAGRDAGLRVVTVRRGGGLVGALPLYLRGGGVSTLGVGVRRLGFLSTGEPRAESTWAEYLDLLHAPGEADACLDQALAALRGSEAGRWDVLEFRDIAASSPLLRWRGLREAGLRASASSRGESPVADLSGGFESYLGRLSPGTRQQARRLLRAVETEGLSLELAATPDEADRYFDQLVELHQARWAEAGRPGCFASRRFSEFHRTLSRLWVPEGRAVLARLARDGVPVAVLYGFPNRAKFDFYQSGVVLAGTGRLRSPGVAAHLALMQYLASRGIEAYDFLRGASEYKARLATDSIPLARLRVTRPGVRSAADGMGEWAIGLARSMIRDRSVPAHGSRPGRGGTAGE